MSAPHSIADTSLGLTQSEIQIFRQHQQVLTQQLSQQGSRQESNRANRGPSRGGSNVPSANSSQSNAGRVVLDRNSLQSLQSHFDSLMTKILDQHERLTEETQNAVNRSANSARSTMQDTEDQITRTRQILARLDALEEHFKQVKHIRDAVKELRRRTDAVDARMDATRRTTNQDRHRR